MALISTPPWIPNFNTWLEAMHSGGALGLQRRGQDIQASEAAAALIQRYQAMGLQAQQAQQHMGLSWAQLAADREANLARLRQAASTQQAALALRSNQLESLNAYRQLEAQNQMARIEESRRHGAETASLAAAGLDMRQRYFDLAKQRESDTMDRFTQTQDRLIRSQQESLQRQQAQFLINRLEKDSENDIRGAAASRLPENKLDATSLLDKKRYESRQRTLESLYRRAGLQEGGGESTATQGAPEYIRDTATGRLVPRGQSAAPAPAPAAPPAAAALQPNFGISSSDFISPFVRSAAGAVPGMVGSAVGALQDFAGLDWLRQKQPVTPEDADYLLQ